MSIPVRAVRGMATATLVVALGVGAVACGSDGGGGSESGTEIGQPATLDASSTTTTTAPPTSTTTAPPTTVAEPAGLAEPAAAATELYDAWVAGDRAAAATIADPAAVEGIFAAAPGPYQLYRGCDTGEFDTGGCLFRDRSTNNTIQVDVERRTSGWVVSGTFFSPG